MNIMPELDLLLPGWDLLSGEIYFLRDLLLFLQRFFIFSTGKYAVK